MKKLLMLLLTDFKKIFRDSTLTMIFVVPILFILLLRYALPYISKHYVAELADYSIYIAIMFSVLAAFFPAFIISFIMLDEKDEHLFEVMKVLPFSPFLFFLYRIGFIIVFGTLFSFMTMWLSNIFNDAVLLFFVYSLLFSIFSAIIGLFIISYARNKIEGVTYFKVLNTFLVIPLLAFFIPSNWINMLGIIPLHWVYQGIHATSGKGIYLLIGFAYSFSLLFLMFKVYRRKVFR